MTTELYTGTFTVLTCCRKGCGITFGVPQWWESKRREDHTMRPSKEGAGMKGSERGPLGRHDFPVAASGREDMLDSALRPLLLTLTPGPERKLK